MDVLELFPRHILEGDLEPTLLSPLQRHAEAVLQQPERSPDASAKLAGQLTQQRELSLQEPAIAELCSSVLLPGCERWIRHVIDKQPPQGRGPWTPGRYQLRMVDVWLNSQQAGDYNPTHTHGGSFSGVIFLQVPPQISGESFDGQLCFHGPEERHIQSFRTGIARYVLPKPGATASFRLATPTVMPFEGWGTLVFGLQCDGDSSAASQHGNAKSLAISDNHADLDSEIRQNQSIGVEQHPFSVFSH